MPALQSYDVLLDFTNDMADLVSIQLLRDYGRHTSRIMLLKPAETLTLILESGSSYQYAVKLQTKVVNVTARSWRDIQCHVSHLFMGTLAESIPSSISHHSGLNVDRVWKDTRFSIWAD
ncbi:hypothetical protein CPB83DRAFT_785896 [Crepidotus variabilis]|uniref:Uncharacterized protein n=1 Tax=Crepidotus variabilis TaxID=179855 RepID=A0A9P6JTK8_9AGAR|nr:hypothetical protein CPB83DRAFT_785896 [Crepidotus variabilis]